MISKGCRHCGSRLQSRMFSIWKWHFNTKQSSVRFVIHPNSSNSWEKSFHQIQLSDLISRSPPPMMTTPPTPMVYSPPPSPMSTTPTSITRWTQFPARESFLKLSIIMIWFPPQHDNDVKQPIDKHLRCHKVSRSQWKRGSGYYEKCVDIWHTQILKRFVSTKNTWFYIWLPFISQDVCMVLSPVPPGGHSYSDHRNPSPRWSIQIPNQICWK